MVKPGARLLMKKSCISKHIRWLIMQHVWVVYLGISHSPLVFSWYTHDPLSKCAYQECTSEKWDIPWYTTRKCCIIILCHAIEKQWPTQLNETYAKCMLGRLGVMPSSICQKLFCFLICYNFYGMFVGIHEKKWNAPGDAMIVIGNMITCTTCCRIKNYIILIDAAYLQNDLHRLVLRQQSALSQKVLRVIATVLCIIFTG